MSARARTSLAFLAALGLLVTPAARAADGKAEGTITVNGKTTKLAHAYARAVKGFFDKTKEDVEVILSDVPLEAKALEDPFERSRMADAGKLHAFEITIDADGKPISTAFRDNGFKKASPSGLSSADVFTKKVFDGKTVEGSYKSAKESEFFGNTYSFDVSFKANVARAPKPVQPTAAETAAAQKSPQAAVYADFLRAIQKEDLPALKKLFTKEQAKNLDDPEAKKMVGMVKMMSPTEIKVLRVVETGDKADLTVTGKQDGSVASGVVHMVKEGGAWKVQREEWKN
ncbi:MAG TPA: DUF4878 domain-containing protein [Thermoanaerobaculia bacterium]|nr:DUF4878 domain-containing protein [Thermoanaerobaculia bacterium]